MEIRAIPQKDRYFLTNKIILISKHKFNGDNWFKYS
jgi:hypothetical protein